MIETYALAIAGVVATVVGYSVAGIDPETAADKIMESPRPVRSVIGRPAGYLAHEFSVSVFLLGVLVLVVSVIAPSISLTLKVLSKDIPSLYAITPIYIFASYIAGKWLRRKHRQLKRFSARIKDESEAPEQTVTARIKRYVAAEFQSAYERTHSALSLIPRRLPNMTPEDTSNDEQGGETLSEADTHKETEALTHSDD